MSSENQNDKKVRKQNRTGAGRGIIQIKEGKIIHFCIKYTIAT